MGDAPFEANSGVRSGTRSHCHYNCQDIGEWVLKYLTGIYRLYNSC